MKKIKNTIAKVILITFVVISLILTCIVGLFLKVKAEIVDALPHHKYRNVTLGFSLDHIMTFYIHMESSVKSTVCMWDFALWETRYQFYNRDMVYLNSLPHIRKLDCSDKLKNVNDEGLEQLQLDNLIELHLYNKQILTCKFMLGLPKLKKLYLNGLQVKSGNWQYLLALKNLTSLNLAGTNISNKDLKHLSCLSNIQFISFQCTKISDAGLKYLSHLTNLCTFDLSFTKISNKGLQYLSNLNKLNVIDLSYTKISDAGLKYLSHLTNTQYLNLSHTNVSDKGLKFLSRMNQLREIHLAFTNIQGKTLGNIKTVEILSLKSCELSNAKFIGLQKLRKLCLTGYQMKVSQNMISELSKIKTLEELYIRSSLSRKHHLDKALPSIKVLDQLFRGDMEFLHMIEFFPY
ncbi:leucine-rich repeat domain-containing protein [Candidatus Uabimicrobium sp. HlEnr_7]|uniref:leucine-rich repeat domain-containing protein n=1 Tax=Candidatus Uabimicrobium helgolandensis TaxID=3095367 RepID=UPI0035576DA2